MTSERFWVVGGDYTCTGFKELRDGSATVMGPYHARDEAQAAWRRVSDENRSKATARYAITSEKVVLPH
ncbi:MAG: hypothetical protein JSR45_00580 [Proteobacteria bacterium]|nr:hypothetical protein [Pseudomonadota bacterium]